MLGVSLSGPCRNLGESKAKVRADEATDAQDPGAASWLGQVRALIGFGRLDVKSTVDVEVEVGRMKWKRKRKRKI